MTPDNAVKAKKKRRGQFHHGDLREQLVIAATELLEKKGLQAFSMKELATRLGVTEPAVYRHYDGREALLAEVALRGYLDFTDALARGLGDVTDPFESIRRYAHTYVRYCVAHPGWFRVQFTRAATENFAQHSDVVRDRMRGSQEMLQRLFEIWKGALPRGEEDRVADLYRLVWGTVHGLAGFVVERVFQLVKTDEERIAAADEAIEVLVQSIEARARSR